MEDFKTKLFCKNPLEFIISSAKNATSRLIGMLDQVDSLDSFKRPDTPNRRGVKRFKRDSSPTLGDSKNVEPPLRTEKVLIHPSELRIGWSGRRWAIGAGMNDNGNCSYINATLQALFHIPMFAKWLLSVPEAMHAEKCCLVNACLICCMRTTLQESQRNVYPITPLKIYSQLPYVGAQFIHGRQEDAYEFLRSLLNAMERSYQSRFISITSILNIQESQCKKYTNPLKQMFGLQIRAVTKCISCETVTTTYENQKILRIDINNSLSLDQAIESYFGKVILDEGVHDCPQCERQMAASRQLFVDKCPSVICVALKRFSLNGLKLFRHVNLSDRVSLDNYVTVKKQQASYTYRLVSVVVHTGSSCRNGHYTAAAEVQDERFFKFDDTIVGPAPLSAALQKCTYLMFYERILRFSRQHAEFFDV